jgi:hypothetical protein
MFKKLVVCAVTAAGLAGVTAPAHARGFFAVSVGVPAVVVAPAPYYVGPPAVVGPRYVVPPVAFGPGYAWRGWGYGYGWDHGRYPGWDRDHFRGDAHHWGRR